MNDIKFAYSERLLGFNSDNLITYFAGPIKIKICGWTEEIEISCKKKWDYLLDEVLDVAKNAWEIEENQIKWDKDDNKTKIIIKYNFKNIKLYIEHNIVFL